MVRSGGVALVNISLELGLELLEVGLEILYLVIAQVLRRRAVPGGSAAALGTLSRAHDASLSRRFLRRARERARFLIFVYQPRAAI
jgi:hypothetical protein